MTPPFVRATWYGGQIVDAEGNVICHVSGEAEMQLLLDALNHRAMLIDALTMLLDDVEGAVDMGMPFSNPENGFHESVMASLKALGRV